MSLTGVMLSWSPLFQTRKLGNWFSVTLIKHIPLIKLLDRTDPRGTEDEQVMARGASSHEGLSGYLTVIGGRVLKGLLLMGP